MIQKYCFGIITAINRFEQAYMALHETDELGFEAPAPLGHPARASMPVDHPTGPAFGEKLPGFRLPTADGRILDFHEDRGKSKAALVFFRSVVW
ncbi:MAG: hypothetical protein QGG67_14435 [Gammaproteobacteria bacterium]|nr:hypothetical protein [Gammaproteobacteria bacterium]